MPTLAEAAGLAESGQGLAVVSTLRSDATIQSSLINAALLDHPATSSPGLAFVALGPIKLNNRVMRDERRTAVLINPTRIYGRL